MKERETVVEAGKRMLRSRLTVETWGNLSVCDRENSLIYITPSAMDYDEITAEDIVVLDFDGKVVGGERKPSIESQLHAAIYRARPDVGAVIHTHPIFSTVFSSIGESIPLLHDEAAQALGDVVLTADYALPGTMELAENCVKALGQKANACLLKSHGAVCVSKNMTGCFKVAAVLEMVAEIYYRIRSINGCYCPISDENIAVMKDFAQNKYGQDK